MTNSAGEGKPLGIVVLIVYTAVNAFHDLSVSSPLLSSPGLSMQSAFFLIAGYLLGIVGLAAACGMWRVEAWAHRTAQVFYICSIAVSALGFLTLLSGNLFPGSLLSRIVSLGLQVWALIYLSRPEAKSALGKV